MSLAHFSTGAWLVAIFLGAAWAAPTTPSPGTQPEIERDSRMENVSLLRQATAENNRTESAATTLGVELTSDFPEEVQCQTAWQKFMVEFGVQYSNEAETQKRRGIFCENWRGIQEHNSQYEVGKVSFKKKINQWTDLTFEEWKSKQRPILQPEFAKAKPTAKAPEEDQKRIKCEAAWQKFLTDFSKKYENDAETNKRHSIFCKNWQRIQEHNVQYEAGKVAHKKGINQWSDLTFEEWKKAQESRFPPNMETPGNKTAAAEAHEYPEEKPGTYIAETTLKPKLEIQTVEVPSHIEELEEPSNKVMPANRTEGTQVSDHNEAPGTYKAIREAPELDQKRIKCQAAWEKFLVDFSKKYENDAETEKRRSIFCKNWQSIQEHNAQYEAGIVAHKRGINHWSDLTFEEWRKTRKTRFPPNPEIPGNKTAEVEEHKYLEENPGNYIVETTMKPKFEEQPVEVPTQIQCQAAWKKFLSDYSPKYENDDEAKIRHSIFCDNWQKIQEYNSLYESGKYSHKKNINKWSDLSLEELQRLNPDTFSGNKTNETEEQEYPDMSQRSFSVNTEKPGIYVAEPSMKRKLVNETEPAEVTDQIKDIEENANKELPKQKIESEKCQAAWEKFLTDYKPKYENDEETKIRHSIFCDNWQKIQDFNLLYESGKESHKKNINKWSDLSLEELQRLNRDTFLGNKTNGTEEQEYPDMSQSFPVNTEKPGTYVAEKPKLVNETQSVEVPSQTKDIKKEADKEISDQKAESELDPTNKKCQAAWEKFLSDYSQKYENDDESKVRHRIFCDNWQRIQEHNALFELGKVPLKESISKWSDLTSEELRSQSPNILPPNLKPSENKTDETIVQVGSQQVWFPPNMEAPGIYIKETTVKPKLVDEELSVEVPRVAEFKNTDNTEIPVNENEANAVEVENLKTYIEKREASEGDQKEIMCQAAWEKFLTDYKPKYESDDETKVRRSIFCDNWQRIQSGKVTNGYSINEWSDLTSAELKNQNPNILPPNLKPSGNKAKSTTVQVGSQQIWFPANKEEAGTYTKPARKSESLSQVPSK